MYSWYIAMYHSVTWPRRSWGIHCGQSDEALESPHQGPGVVENEGTLIQKKCLFFLFSIAGFSGSEFWWPKKTSSTTVSSVINQSTNDLVYPASLIYIFILYMIDIYYILIYNIILILYMYNILYNLYIIIYYIYIYI